MHWGDVGSGVGFATHQWRLHIRRLRKEPHASSASSYLGLSFFTFFSIPFLFFASYFLFVVKRKRRGLLLSHREQLIVEPMGPQPNCRRGTFVLSWALGDIGGARLVPLAAALAFLLTTSAVY